ncbi:MAG: hypothetical protein VB093_03420, partial [Propionicimonas sp.]|nr:hypothetical protein [Propionicimonas sp.]
PLTIEATADTTDELVRFLDELRKGPRLLHIVTVKLTGPSGEDPAMVSVSGSAYLQLTPEGALR